MDKWDYWRLCEELTVVQTALLIIGLDPGENPYVMNWEIHDRPDNFSAAFSALTHAINRDQLPASYWTIVEKEWDATTEHYYENDTGKTDWEKTTILVEDTKDWLRKRQLRPEFFFPPLSDQTLHSLDDNNIGLPSYLNKSHPNFSLKLKAAIDGWEAITNAPSLNVSPKTAIVSWLQENAEKYGLIKDDGSLNETGIEEIAKVSHWRIKGGALKTQSNSEQDVQFNEPPAFDPPPF